MSQGTRSFSTADAIHVQPQHDAADRGVLDPDRQRGTQQRDHRLAQGRRDVPRPAVGGNQQPAALRQPSSPQADRLAGQGEHPGKFGQADDSRAMLAFLRPAEDQNVVVQSPVDEPGQRGEVLDRPLLGRAVGAGGVDGDDAAVAAQAQVAPDALAQRAPPPSRPTPTAAIRPRSPRPRPGRDSIRPSASAGSAALGGAERPSRSAAARGRCGRNRSAPWPRPARPAGPCAANWSTAGPCRIAPGASAAPGPAPPLGLCRAGIEIPLLVEPGGAGQQFGPSCGRRMPTSRAGGRSAAAAPGRWAWPSPGRRASWVGKCRCSRVQAPFTRRSVCAREGCGSFRSGRWSNSPASWARRPRGRRAGTIWWPTTCSRLYWAALTSTSGSSRSTSPATLASSKITT